jgi:hypothetical protein
MALLRAAPKFMSAAWWAGMPNSNSKATIFYSKLAKPCATFWRCCKLRAQARRYVTSRDLYVAALKGLGPVYREVMGRNFPAMTCVAVSGLVEERALVEIEVTAVLPDPVA